jgi:small GTP-binding protein
MISKKIILIGDFSTGKTSLIRRFVDNQFSDTYLSTIGVKISKKLIRLANGEVLQGLIWDIEGGTEQKPLNTTYLTGAHGCIIVADVTRQETISNIKSYIESVQKISVSAPFILVLNKCDCISTSQREEIFDKVLSMYNCTTREIYLASAKSGEGVETMFNAIAGQMLAKG